MIIEDFIYHKPHSIEEACKLLEQSDNGAPIAGGTDMLVEIKQGLRHHKEIISLSGINALKNIHENENSLEIGSGVTHNEVASSPVIKKYFPAISEAASKIGTDQIRNTGTVGGNICTGASCCDMAPILLVLNANVEIASSSEKRNVSLKDFFIFHKETSLGKGELLTKIIVSKPEPNTGASFKKFGLRETASISVASAAAMVKFDNNICTYACVVIGAVAPTPIICIRTNEMLIGKNIFDFTADSEILNQAGSLASEDSIPIDDIRGTAVFRRNIIKVLTRRAIMNVVKRAESKNN
ncbi:FAD binding domain-containing protein [Bacteroidota bacterium]